VTKIKKRKKRFLHLWPRGLAYNWHAAPLRRAHYMLPIMPVTSLRYCQHCSDGRGSLGPSAHHASNHEHDVCQPQPLQTSCYTQLLTVQTSRSQTADSAPAAATREAKRPKSSPVRPSACDWYYCAQFTAKPKAACALRFSWAATSSNLGLRATPSKHDVIHKTIST